MAFQNYFNEKRQPASSVIITRSRINSSFRVVKPAAKIIYNVVSSVVPRSVSQASYDATVANAAPGRGQRRLYYSRNGRFVREKGSCLISGSAASRVR